MDLMKDSPMMVRRWKACVALQPFVEAYSVRTVEFGARQAYIPLPARRDCFLEFYLRGRYRVVTVATGAEDWAPRCVLVGPSTRRREDLKLSGSLQVFSIRFSPTGFHGLFGIPARLLRDQALEAGLVLGREVVEVHEQLAAADPAQWQAVAERYLLKRVRMSHRAGEDEIAGRAVAAMQRARGMVGVSKIAAQAAVSQRHLERVFQERVGVSPKMFGRLLRLDHALNLAGPESRWVEIADACGYFDQSHLVRDFRALTGATPMEFTALRVAPPKV
jgi:AraC-like DNA-binding protein